MSKLSYLVAVDGSEWSERGTEYAITLAKQTNANVRLVTVIPYSGFTPINAMELDHIPEMRKEQEASAKNDILAPLMERFGDSGVEVTTEFHWGHPVEVIRGRIKSEKANMIFVGRRGRSRLADLVLGSVANNLAHTVGVPIVLVP